MADFLTTHATAYQIEELIINARKRLVLISPYLQLSHQFLVRLKEADKRRVNITIVCRELNLNAAEEEAFTQIKNLTLYNCPNLHAKCYFNDNKMVITSMNFYEFSEKNNREMGILLEQGKDYNLFSKAVKEADSIISDSEKIIYHEKHDGGTCIRCGTMVQFDVTRPLCHTCFLEWVEYKNLDYIERFCHLCSAPVETTMRKPLCYECYKEQSEF